LLFNRNLIGVDWDQNQIRILQFISERSGKVKVVRSVSKTLEPDVVVEDADKFGPFLRTVLQEHGIKASGVVFAVGRERAFLHQLTIPASPEDQVANLVRFQLAQELPFAIEESVVDYVVTNRNDEGKVTGVLAAAVRTEYVDFLKHAAQKAKLSVSRIGLKPYANFLAVRASGCCSEKNTLFVDLSLKSMEIDVFSSSDGVLFSRSVGIEEQPEKTTPLKESFLDQGILQLKRTLHAQAYMTGAPSGQPQELVISGSSGWETEFSELAGKQLSLPSQVLKLDNVGGIEPAMVAMYGLACAQGHSRSEQIDFLSPKKAVDPQAVRMRYIQLGVAAFALIMILGFLYSNHKVAEKEQLYQARLAENKKLKEQVSKFKTFARQANGVESWMDRKVNWLDQLQQLTDLLPTTDKAYLNSIFMAEGQKGKDVLADISIEGQARNRQTIDQIAQTLVEKGNFKVTPGSTVTLSGEYPDNFKMTLVANRSKAGGKSNSAKEADKTVKNTPTPTPVIEKGLPPILKSPKSDRLQRLQERMKNRIKQNQGQQ